MFLNQAMLLIIPGKCNNNQEVQINKDKKELQTLLLDTLLLLSEMENKLLFQKIFELKQKNSFLLNFLILLQSLINNEIYLFKSFIIVDLIITS